MKQWGLSAFYTAAIYLSLPFSSAWQKGLRAALGTQFEPLLNLSLLSGILLLGIWAVRLSRLRILLFMLFALIALALAIKIDIPEERIHLLEYGLLGALLFQAMPSKTARRTRIGVVLLLGTLIGLGDEGIQWVLPDRVFDWWDVAYNFAGVSFGAAFCQILRPEA